MAVTPQPGFQVDPTNPNGVVPIPGYTPDTTPPPAATPPTEGNSASQVTPAQLPTPQTLQNETPGQLQMPANGSITDLLNSTGQSSAYSSRAALATQLGISNYTGTASQNQQLAQKYVAAHNSLGNSAVPNSASEATTQVGTAISQSSPQSTDPIFNSLTASMAPILQSLTQVISDINNPTLTGQSLQSEYNTLAQQNNLPQLQSELLNYQNIMNGTTQDIRDEITSAGGVATESQVQAMSASRNTVLLKQYNALSSQYTAAQTNVSNMMQYASTDQQTALQKEQITASITNQIAGVESQMQSMALNMQQNAVSAAQYNISQTGYTAFAQTLQGNPQMQGYYENLLNLAPGTLSNPQALSSLDTYKQQQLAISEQNAQNAGNRTVIYAEAQGYPLPGTNPSPASGTVTSNGTTGPAIDPNSLVRPSFVAANVPLSISASDAQSMIAGAPKGTITSGGTAGSNAYGNNFTVNGVGNYVAQPDGSYILGSALPPAPTSDLNSIISAVNTPGQQVPPMNYTDIKAVEAAAPPSTLSPTSTAFSKETLAVKRLLQYQVTSPVYSTVSQAPLPFARIQAAKNGNNSVSDTELLDSYITLAKGQGQITEAQISAITNASSVSDKLNIIKQKVAGAGALISTDQRASLLALSGSVFDQYSQQYQTLYTQGINLLAQNHIAPSFWGTLPDFTQMFSGADLSSNQLFNSN